MSDDGRPAGRAPAGRSWLQDPVARLTGLGALAGGAGVAAAHLLGGGAAAAVAGAVGVGAVSWALAQASASGRAERAALLHAAGVAGEAAPAQALASWRARLEREVAALRAERDRAGAMVEATPNGVVLVGSDGRVLLANAPARTFLRARREPVGRLPVEAFPLSEVVEVLEAAAERGRATATAVAGERDLALDALPAAGGFMLLVRDDTEARRAERARTAFVANVSHELRTPIAAIQGYAELLLSDRERLAPQDVELVEVIHRNGRRLSALFDDLLNLHRIESRRRELPRQVVAVGPLLRRACETAADRARSRRQTFSVTCPEGLEAVANPEALTSIVGNLATNGVKYTPEGGAVTVAARAGDEDEVVVEVTDTGVGIPAAHHARIFERFYRVDEGRARTAGGTGLGLAIVKHLALASGARLSFDSEEGVGSTFRVHLPRRLPAALPESAPSRRWDVTLGEPSPNAAESER